MTMSAAAPAAKQWSRPPAAAVRSLVVISFAVRESTRTRPQKSERERVGKKIRQACPSNSEECAVSLINGGGGLVLHPCIPGEEEKKEAQRAEERTRVIN